MVWRQSGDKLSSEPMMIIHWHIYAALSLSELKFDPQNPIVRSMWDDRMSDPLFDLDLWPHTWSKFKVKKWAWHLIISQPFHSMSIDPPIPGFPQTSLEKFQWLFNDISRQKFPNFHDNSERHKTENHRTTCYAWPSYTPYVHYWVLLRKSVKVFLFHLMNSISVNNTCKIHIYLPRLSVKTTSISEFNDFSMSDWSKIQWIFHDFVILTNFKNFSWNSMIFQWSWNRSEFQWFFKSCGNPAFLRYSFFKIWPWKPKSRSWVISVQGQMVGPTSCQLTWLKQSSWLLAWAGYPAGLRQVPMCCASYGSRQVIHPVLQMQLVGSL